LKKEGPKERSAAELKLRSQKKIALAKVIDNGPLLRIAADSALNNRISLGNKFNKKMINRISNEASPDLAYMGSRIDLSFPNPQE